MTLVPFYRLIQKCSTRNRSKPRLRIAESQRDVAEMRATLWLRTTLVLYTFEQMVHLSTGSVA